MKSMTGFGSAMATTKTSQIEVSLRSVNGRFLEPRFHLPREFHAHESELKKILGATLKRGTVDVFISRKVRTQSQKFEIEVQEDLVRAYAKALGKVGQILKNPSKWSPEVLARMPDVLKIESSQQVTSEEVRALLKTFAKACKAHDLERIREGKSLRKDMFELLSFLEVALGQMNSLRQEANEQLLARFESKIKARAPGLDLDQARLSQEVVMQIDKSDINEELVRLKEHLRNYREVLEGEGPHGKKLDFYTQELLREVNTIGSKSSLSKLTQIVVEAKTQIERLREQVQNAE